MADPPARRDRTALPSALASWLALERTIDGRPLTIFLDYDGTLTPIVSRPELAVLGDDMRAALASLARVWPTVIVTGRAREDVQRLVSLDTIAYAGSHGFDIVAPGPPALRHLVGEEHLPIVRTASEALRIELEDVEGARVEDKRFAVAIHYRLVNDANVARVEAAVDRVIAAEPMLRKTGGKKIFEVRPAIEWDKGHAVLWLLDALDAGPEAVPIYVGDDVTDEDAFAAIAGHGIGIVVGADGAPTLASYALRDTDEVRVLLDRLRSLG
jgi:alpha,alpha-trehalase